MKVILLADVPKVGKKGEVVDVSDGYGRNFLVGRKLAKEATQENINAAKNASAAAKHRKAEEKRGAQELAADMDGKRVTVTAKTGGAGRLFGAVTSKEVAEAVKDQLKVQVDKKAIEIPGGSIKTLGEHQVTLRVYAETTAKITVDVQAE